MLSGLSHWPSSVLPYPHLEWEPLNCVFACYRCNQNKGDFDPLDKLRENGVDVANPLRLLQEKERRLEIIEIARGSWNRGAPTT